MIRSMTGYGRGICQDEGKEFTVEIKSVNNRYHDISIKLPKYISYLEDFIKKEVLKKVNRGKIDIYVNYINVSNSDKEININEELAKKYISALENISKSMNLNTTISMMDIAKIPDVVTIVDNEDEEKTKKLLEIALNEALDNFIQMRKTEGEKIAEDLNSRIATISQNLEKISALSTGLVDEYIVKLRERIKEILTDNKIDENRIAMEAVMYADKTSIEEELTRLKSHISQFKAMLLEDKPIGKQIDFLIQEMNRETNTIASKANCLGITQIVVELKNELENIREQIQNVE